MRALDSVYVTFCPPLHTPPSFPSSVWPLGERRAPCDSMLSSSASFSSSSSSVWPLVLFRVPLLHRLAAGRYGTRMRHEGW